MPLFVSGLNHRSAPVDVRERVVFPVEALQSALRELAARPDVDEAVIISTCNRTEIYAVCDDGAALAEWLGAHHQLEPGWLAPYLYLHEGQEAVVHLLRVASGLDSLVLGEPQILGQAKTAYLEAQDAGSCGRILDRLFQHCFSVAKQVRTDTSIGSSPVSVAYAAVRLAHQIFGKLERQRALLIGAGEMMELTARHLREHGLGGMIIANRSLDKARKLARRHEAAAIELVDIPSRLAEADIIIASTASQLPVLGKGAVERALKRRKHRPMFMVDMAVPRDIEPEVGDLSDVYLYTVDDLREVIEENLRSRQDAARQAEIIVHEQGQRFMGWLRSQDAVTMIRRYRRRAASERDAVLELARRRLAAGASAEEALEYLADTLTNKLTHGPTAGLRQTAAEGDQQALALCERLLDLTNREPS